MSPKTGGVNSSGTGSLGDPLAGGEDLGAFLGAVALMGSLGAFC